MTKDLSYLTALLAYICTCSVLAWHLVVSPSSTSRKIPTPVRQIALLLICWAGALVLAQVVTQISIHYFDPADFPEDRGLTAEAAYDGVGNNVFAVFLGWIFYPLSLSIARVFKLLSRFRKANA